MTAVATAFGLATTLVLLLASAAAAQTGYPPPPQPPKVVQTLPSPPPPVRKVAFTGADILQWVVVGAVLVALGTLLVVANRRRSRVAV